MTVAPSTTSGIGTTTPDRPSIFSLSVPLRRHSPHTCFEHDEQRSAIGRALLVVLEAGVWRVTAQWD